MEGPKILLIGNIKGDGSRSSELVLNEYKKKFNYAKIIVPETRIHKKFYKIFIYPAILLFNRGYDGYHIIDHSYGHLVYFLPKNKTIITCHDIIPIIFKDKMSLKGRVLFNFYISGLKKAKKILPITKSTKNDLINNLGIKANKMTVTPNCIDLTPFRQIKEKNELKKKYNLENRKVVLSFGYGFYKNTPRGLKALERVRRVFPQIIMLKIGKFNKNEEEIIDNLKLRKNIIQKSNISTSSLVELYNCADVLLFPSLHEGFGRPPLESMKCGVPVITSKMPFLEEIHDKKSILLVNPRSVKEIGDAMILLIKDNKLRKNLIKRGLIEVKDINFRLENKCKIQLKKVYKEISFYD